MVDRQGPNFRNGFGFDYVLQRQEWAQMCPLDSDGDGISNGVELLDPDCLWRAALNGQANTPLPEGEATHPGDPNDPNQCGDGLLQGTESCDGSALNDQTCVTMGYQGGQLSCTSTCTFDDSDCIAFPPTDMAIRPFDMTTRPDQDLLMDGSVDAELQSGADGTIDEDADMMVPVDSGLRDSNASNLDGTLAEDERFRTPDHKLRGAVDTRIPLPNDVDTEPSESNSGFGSNAAPNTSQGCHHGSPISLMNYCWFFLVMLGFRRTTFTKA